MDNSLQFKTLFKLGFALNRLPQDIFQELTDEVNSLLHNNFNSAEPANNQLAGAIEHEYNLSNNQTLLDHLNNVILPFYWQQWEDPLRNKKFKYSTKTWVNFQRKYEYNPLHSHSGMLSFVIWIKIPYNIKDEENRPAVNRIDRQKNTNKTGITFVYPNFLAFGGLTQYNLLLDKNYEGQIVVFPAFLNHIVYPFYTSDEYRISISGNLIPED